jgi:hypothetical protein
MILMRAQGLTAGCAAYFRKTDSAAEVLEASDSWSHEMQGNENRTILHFTRICRRCRRSGAVAEKVVAPSEMPWIPGRRDLLPAIPGQHSPNRRVVSPLISLEENP